METKKKNYSSFNQLLNYIDLNISKDIDMEDLASKLNLSKSRFHRVFTGIMEETIGSYMKRRKLEIAAKRISYSSKEDITQILYDLNYSTKSYFSKVFKEHFGVTPSEFRKEMLSEYENIIVSNHNNNKEF